MKTLLAAVSGCALLLGMLSSGGCVSAEEYEKLKQLNRNVNDELNKCRDGLRLAQADNERLKGELADRDRTLRNQADQIALLTGTNNSLSAALAEARKKLGDLERTGPFIALPQPLHKALLDWAARNPGLVKYYPENGMVKFEGDMTFDPGSVAIKPPALAALKKFAEILGMAEAKPFNVYVAGHTDDIPIVKPETRQKYEDNWGLSSARSKAVIKALYNENIEQERMGGVFFSKYHPIAPNAPGNKGNVLNRRVEIWIVPNTTLLTQPSGSIPAGRAGERASPETGD